MWRLRIALATVAIGVVIAAILALMPISSAGFESKGASSLSCGGGFDGTSVGVVLRNSDRPSLNWVNSGDGDGGCLGRAQERVGWAAGIGGLSLAGGLVLGLLGRRRVTAASERLLRSLAGDDERDPVRGPV